MRAQRDLADGAILVADHRDKNGVQGPVYVMKKEGSGYGFYAADEKGATLVDAHAGSTARAACEGCHADAPHPPVFVPR